MKPEFPRNLASKISRCAFLSAILLASFIAGRISSSNPAPLPFPRFSGWAPPDTREDTFLMVVKGWREFIAKQDGFIPVDPYRGLLSSDSKCSVDLLRNIYFARYLPPRINRDLSKNPRYVVFTFRAVQPEGDFNWEYYADDSWAKVPVSNRLSADYGSTNEDNWTQDFQKTGFPDWKSQSERDAWVATNKDRLSWDDQLKEYVVSTQPTN